MGLDRPSAGASGPRAQARESFERREWANACTILAAADPATLELDDVERLAVAAYLTGNDERSDDAWLLAHERCLDAGDVTRAARSAFWLGWNLLLRGEMARSAGWLARARTLLEDSANECAVCGLLLIAEGLDQVDNGDARAAYETFDRARAIGEQFADRDVVVLSLLGRGQALIALGDLARGRACHDEAMVAVVADEVAVPVAGIVYCVVLLECRNTFDSRRAQEWTDALTRWCDAQPDLVPYRGQCLVHRSEVLQLQGRWHDALEEARRACLLLAGHPAIGEAYYQQGEMHRLRGEHDAARSAYRGASQFGREPQPGMALLRLAEGDVAAASASIRRVAAEAEGQGRRARVLAALAEIALAAGDHREAEAAAAELTDIATTVAAPVLVALAAHSRGSVLLTSGHAQSALPPLRAALTIWQEMHAPYEAARERVLIATACRQLGDEDSAQLEFDTARTAFEVLGAAPDVAATDARRAAPDTTRPLPGGLTAREAEVLRLVAAGLSNHEIAVALVVSDHTVRRHLQNIFPKTGVSSRAAATAYAFEQGLMARPDHA